MSSNIVIQPRTFDPKFQHYHHDGSGRDTFVGFNNGGLAIAKLHNPHDTTKFYHSPRKHNYSPSSPRKDGIALEYRSDGSGRDSYILHNSGGLKNTPLHLTGDRFFKQTLR